MAKSKVNNLDPYKIVKIDAMHALIKDTVEYNLRQLQRWFSREFHVPLTKVEDLDVEYLLMHWYECEYEKMTPEEKDEEIKLLIESEADRIERLRKEEASSISDEEFYKKTIAQVNAAKEAATTLTNALKSDNQNLEPIIPLPVMGAQSLPEATLASPNSLPEGIQMEFSESEEDFENWTLFGPEEKSSK